MSRSNIPPTNKKAIKCSDCGKWVTLQGYGGHRRFYHGAYRQELKRRLFNRLCVLTEANKISRDDFKARVHLLGEYSKSTMTEILAVRDFIDSVL